MVDDVEGLRRLVTLVLEKHDGYAVVGEAGDGEAALELVGRSDPDVVLLDLSMPGMDGFEALERILQAGEEVDVIVLSGHEDPDTRNRALDLGAAGFIEKGENPHQLVEDLDAILDA